MTRAELATLACKIMAVWLLTQAVLLGSGMIWYVIIVLRDFTGGEPIPDETAYSALSSGIPGILLLLSAMLLWSMAPWIARRMVRGEPAQTTPFEATPESVLSMACVIIGIVTLVNVVRDLAYFSAEFTRGDIMLRGSIVTLIFRAEAASILAGTALSAWLILGSRGISQIILHIRRDAVPGRAFDPAEIEQKPPDSGAGAKESASR